MTQDSSQPQDSNGSGFVSARTDDADDPTRRTLMRCGAGLSLAAWLAPLIGCAITANGRGPSLGFKPVPVSSADKVVVPDGYTAQVLAPWGEPVGIAGHMPAFKPDASNSAADQALQMGMHHDGMQFFPLAGSRRGLLAINHGHAVRGLRLLHLVQRPAVLAVGVQQAVVGVFVVDGQQAAP